MNGIKVRVNHTDTVTFTGWSKTGRGEYTHESGRKVKRGERGWEIIGGAQCGTAYGTMHVAMYYAGKG